MFSFRNAIFPIDRELRSSLQVMSGIGYYKSFLICAKVGFSFPFSMSNLNFYFFTLLSFFFKGLVVSSDKAKRKMSQRMKILLSVKSWRALRHKDFLPVNGQRTRSNAGVRRREKLIVLRVREEAARLKAAEEEKKKKKLVGIKSGGVNTTLRTG